VKRVPDSEARIKVDSDRTGIDEAGVKFVLNPYDEYAVEEALTLRDAAGEGEVVVVCVGPEAAQETIRTTLAMGADRGVLLKADALPIDPYPVAKALADELRDGAFDVVLFGKMAIDDSSQAVGPMVAELLGLACVSSIASLDVGDGTGTAKREIEGGVEVVEFALPIVLTTDKGLNEPRYPALKGIMQAKKKPLDVKDASLADGGLEIVELAPPPERQAGRIVGEGVEAVPALVEALRNEAKVL
jgi:electron transfer flavoprotein beta subunit